MSKKPCSIEGCKSAARGRGWCGKHWQRWRAHGDPLGGQDRFSDPRQSFLSRTEWQGECLVWTGCEGGLGYGKITVSGREILAHRYAWEVDNGPIPKGMFIDHTCWNRRCVNSAHLRLSTRSENNSYKSGGRSDSRTGVRNVSIKRDGFQVRITAGGKRMNFGTYPTIEQAAAVAAEKRVEIFGAFAGRG